MGNNNQIVYHKSNWGDQLIKVVLVMSFLFFSVKKNPTKEQFTQELIKQYAVKHGMTTSSSGLLSEFANTIFGGLVEPMVKRNDYIVFSTYELVLDNEYIKDSVYAVGFWDNIYIQDKKNNQTTDSTSDVQNSGGETQLLDETNKPDNREKLNW